ncbi:membrane protein insertion efficiency factor YidD [Streptomyces sp. NPDC004783]|uniref:membrane protein insertion efficiency factor YidD n=1 Tax=Streptomyces sp. NPDC004783 TaxID=3154459 RepID=UPI0033BD6A2C
MPVEGVGQVSGRREDDRNGSRKEDCAETCADGCLYGRTCCPQMWIASMFALVVAPTGRRSSAGADDPAAPRPSGRAAGALYAVVRRYRADVSPARPTCCPYKPSCSTYAVRALHRHGALLGARLILGRLLRCRPAAAPRRGFHDPVPR